MLSFIKQLCIDISISIQLSWLHQHLLVYKILKKSVFIYLYVYTGFYRVTSIDVDCNDIIMISIKSEKTVTS